jgi:hypothetical protein
MERTQHAQGEYQAFRTLMGAPEIGGMAAVLPQSVEQAPVTLREALAHTRALYDHVGAPNGPSAAGYLDWLVSIGGRTDAWPAEWVEFLGEAGKRPALRRTQ